MKNLNQFCIAGPNVTKITNVYKNFPTNQGNTRGSGLLTGKSHISYSSILAAYTYIVYIV